MVPGVPAALVTCLFLIIAAGLAAAAGAVMLFLKKQMGQFLILGGGIVMLALSIGCEARYGATGRLTYDLVAGFVIAAAAGLMLIPAFRMTMGLSPNLTGGPAARRIPGRRAMAAVRPAATASTRPARPGWVSAAALVSR